MSSVPRSNNLRLVEKAEPFHTELCLSFSDEVHSLHHVVPVGESIPPALAELVISKYSQKGEVVLDSSCGFGSVPLQAALLGRVVFAADTNPLALKVNAAKLDPADLAEVTLLLQRMDLRRPTDVKLFQSMFSEFYEMGTFREILNLRSFLLQQQGDRRTTQFIEAVALGLLHGHSAGYYSAYTFPQLSISPKSQAELNIKRRQMPEYRSVIPRLLRKTAGVLRDGLPSYLAQIKRGHRMALADARDVSFVPTGSVSLVLTAPILPETPDSLEEQWLRLWFSGISISELRSRLAEGPSALFNLSFDGWLDYCNGVLLEAARVLKPGGHCVLKVRERRVKSYSRPVRSEETTPHGVAVCLDKELAELVHRDFARFFDVEGTVVVRPEAGVLASRTRDKKGADVSERLLVLRRR